MDIMYQDYLVCILRPDIKKGIIIWSNYIQPPNMDSLSTLGLKTGKKLKEEGVDFGRSKIHPYIFFRAPYISTDIDYSTIETEIISSFGQELLEKDNKTFWTEEIFSKYNFDDQADIRTLEKKMEELYKYYFVDKKEKLKLERTKWVEKQLQT